MPKIEYVKQRFNSKSRALLDKCNVLIEKYAAQGYQLTLRQLYYRLVAATVIPNNLKSYKVLGQLINNARLAGLVDWDAIVDRTRYLSQVPSWTSPQHMMHDVHSQFSIDRWRRQEYRPEVWIEKDAMVSVVERVCRELDVPFFSCRGYTSQSEMWGGSQRLLENAATHTPYIIHLGDHDPSGRDMTRDINDRMEMFGVDMKFKRIALNIDQVRKYGLPPNPAKVRDSRFHGYVKEFGSKCWELDALEPDDIVKLIRKTVEPLIDRTTWEQDSKLVILGRAKLAKIAEKFDKAVKAVSKRERKRK